MQYTTTNDLFQILNTHFDRRIPGGIMEALCRVDAEMVSTDRRAHDCIAHGQHIADLEGQVYRLFVDEARLDAVRHMYDESLRQLRERAAGDAPLPAAGVRDWVDAVRRSETRVSARFRRK